MRRFIYGLVALIITATGIAFADSIITGSKPFTFIPGTVISSSQVNANFDYIINQTNTNAAKNGVNSSITALTGLTTPINPNQGGSQFYTSGTAGGTADAITISTTVPAISSYTLSNRNLVSFVAAATNTVTGPTLNVNGTGAVSLSKVTSSAGNVSIRPGEIVTGNTYLVYYNGSNYIVINMPRLFGTSTAIASAGTTDIGTIGSHNVSITGTTTITSFGSSANLAEPIYLLAFTGSLTITFNVTSMITPGGSNMAIRANDRILVEYLGSGNWRILEYMPTNPLTAVSSVNNLGITNNSGTPNTQIDVTAGIAVLAAANFASAPIGGGAFTINAATTGLNGLDTGALAASTWYHVYLIYDGASTAGALLSLSATTPTMPANFVYRYRVGAVRTGAASTFLRTFQRGKRVQYQVIAASTTPNLPIMSSGATGNVATPTYTSIATGNFVPPTATEISVTAYSNGVYILSPNNAYGADASLTNPPFAQNGGFAGGAISMMLDSTNIFWANNSAVSVLACNGWTDAVNAN